MRSSGIDGVQIVVEDRLHRRIELAITLANDTIAVNENAMIVEAWTNARDLEPVVEIHLRAAYNDWTYYDTIDLEHIGVPPRTTVLRVMDVSRFSDGSSELALAVVFDGQETEIVIPFTQDKGSQKLVRKPVSPEPGKLA